MLRPMKKREDCPPAVTRILVMRRRSRKTEQPFHSSQSPIGERQKAEEKQRGRKGNRGDGESGRVHKPGHHKLHLRLTGKGHPHGGPPKDGEDKCFA